MFYPDDMFSVDDEDDLNASPLEDGNQDRYTPMTDPQSRVPSVNRPPMWKTALGQFAPGVGRMIPSLSANGTTEQSPTQPRLDPWKRLMGTMASRFGPTARVGRTMLRPPINYVQPAPLGPMDQDQIPSDGF